MVNCHLISNLIFQWVIHHNQLKTRGTIWCTSHILPQAHVLLIHIFFLACWCKLYMFASSLRITCGGWEGTKQTTLPYLVSLFIFHICFGLPGWQFNGEFVFNETRRLKKHCRWRNALHSILLWTHAAYNETTALPTNIYTFLWVWLLFKVVRL